MALMQMLLKVSPPFEEYHSHQKIRRIYIGTQETLAKLIQIAQFQYN